MCVHDDNGLLANGSVLRVTGEGGVDFVDGVGAGGAIDTVISSVPVPVPAPPTVSVDDDTNTEVG